MATLSKMCCSVLKRKTLCEVKAKTTRSRRGWDGKVKGRELLNAFTDK